MASENQKRMEELSVQAQQQLKKIRREFGFLDDDEKKSCPRSPQESNRGNQTKGETSQAAAGKPDFWSELARVRAQYGIPQEGEEQPSRQSPPPRPAPAPCPRRQSPVVARAAAPQERARDQVTSEPPKPDFWSELARVRAKYGIPQEDEEQPRSSPPPSSAPCPSQQTAAPRVPSPVPCPPSQQTAASRALSPVPCPSRQQYPPVAARSAAPAVNASQERARAQVTTGPPKPDFWTELARVRAKYGIPQEDEEQPRPCPPPSPPPCPIHSSPVRAPSLGNVPSRVELAQPSQHMAAPRAPSPGPCPSRHQSPAVVARSAAPPVNASEQARGQVPKEPPKPDFWSELARVRAQYGIPQEDEKQLRPCPFPSPPPFTPALPPPMEPSCPDRPYLAPGLHRGPRPNADQRRENVQREQQFLADEQTTYWATAAAEDEDYWKPQYSSYYDEGPLPNPFQQNEIMEEFDPLHPSPRDQQRCPAHYNQYNNY